MIRTLAVSNFWYLNVTVLHVPEGSVQQIAEKYVGRCDWFILHQMEKKDIKFQFQEYDNVITFNQ